MIDLDDDICSAKAGPMVEVLAKAKVDLKKGDVLDDIGGFKTYGICENSDISRMENLLPMGLARGAVLKKNVPKDQVLTLDDVECVEDTLLMKLWREQNDFFRTH